MLGKKDIERELGKGINIYPFHEKNLKENSINLTLGTNAWTLGDGKVSRESRGKYVLSYPSDKKDSTISYKKGQSAIIKEETDKFLILLPHSTTIVETSEVIAVGNNIGGTFHSKVGIVTQGIGDIGTMLGPCFCGHLMIALHNLTNEVKTLKIGDTFVSLVFHYLDTPSDISKNSNISGHVDKLSELGIHITRETREFLSDDWKMDIKSVSAKMKNSNEYKEYVEKKRNERKKEWVQYVNVKNSLLLFVAVLMVFLLGAVAYYADSKSKMDVWVDRYWTILIASIVAPLVASLGNLFKKK